MKNMKGCTSTQIHQLSISKNRRHPSAGTFYTSSAGAVISLILVLAFTFVFNLISPTPTYADSISLSIDTNNLAINIMPTSSAGDFAKSNNMNISVSTTSSSGYTLGIASSTGSTDLTNQSDNTAKITSVSSPISESDFSNSSNTQYNNKWGYKPSQYAILDNEGHPTIYPNTNFRPLPGTNGEIIAKTECANGTAPCTNPVDTYTLSIGARANNQTVPGAYNSDTFIIAAVANKSVIECDSSKLCVQYNGNGLSYPETSSQLPRTVNNVNYNSTSTSQTITKYSHTPNVDDAGTQSGNYPDDTNLNEVVTIPGATTLHLKFTFGGEQDYDWTSIWQGNHPDYTAANNYSSGIQSCGTATSNGGRFDSDSKVGPVECDISGDTVTFGFHSDEGYAPNGFGYYAIITGTGTVYNRSVSSGEYATPTGTTPVFHGWSTSQTTPGGGLPSDVEYVNESEILGKMPGDEGETKTLYAVWQHSQAITFTIDSNVTKIDVLNSSGTTVGTITSSGQSLNLAQGDTYTIKPSHTTGYVTNSITKTSGAGTLNGKTFTVGNGSATLSVTSRVASLYDFVAEQSKGTQTLAQLRAEITTSNSGIYEYDSSVFGTASDAANTSTIYYYRGILDNTTGTYGSDGDNAAWPNTVLLDTTGNGKDTTDTCWRIVRTTGSGGVKMIYQGKWTGSTCANSTTNANAVSDIYFNRRSTSTTNHYDTKGRIIYVGYNFSSNSSHQTGTSSVNNSTLFVNGTKSNLRTQLESWYNSNMTAWTSKLETSAGWCNDRTTYSSTATSSKTTSNIPYKTSSATVYFGAYIRNNTTNSQPTLGCPNDTGYDLLTTSNGYIGVPSAPLTADEAAFAGSGYTYSTTPYHANSFLRSGDSFWLLSPYYRDSGGRVLGFYLLSIGRLDYDYVSNMLGVRPSISLTSGTKATSGTGTAADPWIVNP